ncbi:sarcosine oxidase subunit delta family protein [Streptomyces europaeiscabiei]|uniref:Sarcosine oxidase subunit delta family protein n=4 Tax=Streptomyces europaeiscabiei TaxID=146819 RepID=A0ABU4NXC7_9ACTN|nr:sarcosine oxidase subunit delta family protein [Streptomyces europaeiscabiei]MDX2527251.1 sarcosine oxidase subunit delta family protein [Streptomyces europaeiscabiei]MDX2775243.1 sarcosine oxidase subunit delta family protein [Streptomyces europaeiscabiei]MDX3549111.1 sarcosine oxidase subunit delta family protein [Streptomyces europaeiscabiei]MDX3558329.1 sarcosine oxidase subunit delta family protein [Streptomyces europaeiscabiei]MDX3706190.1 sarcosine oxidase subunit delta family protei
MLLITCPWCGPRDEAEFHYGGQAHVPYPETPSALTDEEWARYLFFRDNTKGPFAERWSHAAGCRKWFNAVRDTSTNEILAVYRAGEPRPATEDLRRAAISHARGASAAPPASSAPRPVTSRPSPAQPARPAREDEAVQAEEGSSGGAAPREGTGSGGGGAASVSGSAAGQPFRHLTRGRIDRATPLTFTFDGTEYQGYQGDTLASALLAGGVVQTGTSIKLGRPRGIFSAGVEEPNAVIQIEAPFPEPMLPATTVELYDGLVASSLPGQGRLATEPDPARYDAVHAHCDLLIVGAGPAGLAAAAAAANSGARVILADDQPHLGGSLLGTGEHLDWAEETAGRLDTAPEVRVLRRTTVFGYYDDNHLLAVERRTNHLGAAAPGHVSRERVWRIRARRVVLATGAHERSLAFADNDRPGVMLAASARTYANRHGVLPGRRAVVFTTNDSAYAAALDLAAAGVDITAIVDTRPEQGEWARRAQEAGIEVLAGHAVTGTEGGPRLTAVTAAPHGEPAEQRRFAADLLLVSGGWNPVAHLFSQAGGRLRHDETLGSFVPDTCRQAVEVAGGASGEFDLAGVLAQGAAAGARAIEAEGYTPESPRLPDVAAPPRPTPPMHVYVVPDASGAPRFVDLQRDVTVDDLTRATGAGMRSVEHTKRYTTAGTANDQGKTSGVLASGVVAELLGVDISALGTTTFRPPYTPVSFAALAGRDRGALSDPVRTTAVHEWHVAHGALFENVGQWKRPWYYPQGGETMESAVLRECAAAREGVAFMDASTLGKIDVQGPDAAVLLDRLYTNMMSTLKVGMIRYGVMCRPDGMLFDDGTVIRVAQDRFLVTTTTGNAAAVLDWMEEWLQTEWPELKVHCTSVTEQWATVALVGPRSRDVLGTLAPQLAVSNDDFPFMAWRGATVAGIEARVCRISFSGELAYEINVSPWDALTLWQALYEAGAPYGITPYGTETMHVLRAEKGYPIIGQDTDGTVTPQDLGMSWVVSKKKPDFIGKRSYARADTLRADRKHLVGLLPEDPGTFLPEGTHLVADSVLPAPPVPMLGHVTSSYRSAALGRTFALALIKGGRDRIGERLYAPVGDRLVPVTVASPVLYDPEGARRDG